MMLDHIQNKANTMAATYGQCSCLVVAFRGVGMQDTLCMNEGNVLACLRESQWLSA